MPGLTVVNIVEIDGCHYLLSLAKAKETIQHFWVLKNRHLHNETKCKAFIVKMSAICMRIRNHFHINGFAISLTLKQRLVATHGGQNCCYSIFPCEWIATPNIHLVFWNKSSSSLPSCLFQARKFKSFGERSPKLFDINLLLCKKSPWTK